jgi:hypothetical protein
LNLLWSAVLAALPPAAATGRSPPAGALAAPAIMLVARIKAPPIQRRQSNVRLPIFRSSAETTCFSSLGQPEI